MATCLIMACWYMVRTARQQRQRQAVLTLAVSDRLAKFSTWSDSVWCGRLLRLHLAILGPAVAVE